MKITTKFLIGLAILIVLSPLGLLLPEHFMAGSAWGEWGMDEMQKLVGYIPQGLERLSNIWSAPFPDYALKGWEEKGLLHFSFAYIMSAIIGIAIVVILALLIGRMLSRKGE